ncbi:MAG: hypothetical protein Kow00133_08840 [Amphiplicatus sp.]
MRRFARIARRTVIAVSSFDEACPGCGETGAGALSSPRRRAYLWPVIAGGESSMSKAVSLLIALAVLAAAFAPAAYTVAALA